MPSTVQIERHDARTAPLDVRLAGAHLRAAAYAVSFPEDPPMIPEADAEDLRHVTPGEDVQLFLARDERGEPVGWATLGYSTEQNLHIAFADVLVHPDHTRRGVGRALAAAVLDAARAEGRRTITVWTGSRRPAGEAFARALGAEPALPMISNELRLDALDAALLARWTARPDSEPYRLHHFTRIPEAYLERTAQVMMVMNTAPKGDLDMDDWTITPEMIRAWEDSVAAAGEQRHLMAVEHLPTGELVAYTEVFWSPQRAPLVYQGATAVRPDHRGRGLGKWLKASMLQHVRAHCPGAARVRTGNADVNAAMLGINHALGFAPFMTRTEWQGDVQALTERLHALGATPSHRQPEQPARPAR
ncbi:GNAT family N-acetyltransferase [Deinococcus maricopensis]|nr:GNAT family N-acetyltransferase [Deinococcus maricopensis]